MPDYVVGRSTSRRWKKIFDPRCRFLIPTPPCHNHNINHNHDNDNDNSDRDNDHNDNDNDYNNRW